jgi:hypothetical protein
MKLSKLFKQRKKNKICNAYIEELCASIDKEELNSHCQICGIKIAFHKRKKIKNVKHIKNITQHITNNYNVNDILSHQKNENLVESIRNNNIFNLPANLLKTFFTEWIQIKDLSRLDHGLCESIKRKIFIEALNGIKLFGLSIDFFTNKNKFDDDAYQSYDNVLNFYLQWLSKRNIFIINFFVTRWDVVNEHNYYRFYHLEKLVINLNCEPKEFNLMAFKLMLRFCVKLKYISINNCNTFHEGAVDSTYAYFAKFDFICIHNCDKFNDKCLTSLSLNSQNLTELKLINLSNVAFENFDEFCENLVNLKKLTISNCNCFSNDCLISISQNCKNLKYLSLNYIQNISDEGLVHFKKGFFKLKTLTIHGCENIKNLDEKKIKNDTDYIF